MREYKKLPVGKCKPPLVDPRVSRDPATLQAMADSLRRLGQQCPVLVYRNGEFFVLLDGLTRWAAAQLAGLEYLDALILDEPPSAADQSITVAAIDAHRKNFTPIERARQLVRIQSERQCGVGELAGLVSMSQPLVSKLLALTKLPQVIQQQLEAGTLDLERGYILSQEPDPAKQLELAKDAAALDRSQLRRQVKSNGESAAKPEAVKLSSARFPLAGGTVVSVQGRDISLGTAIEALTETVKQLKKALSQNLDVVTAQRVMKDQSKLPA
jgi:ParB family chromosome partitioning protein